MEHPCRIAAVLADTAPPRDRKLSDWVYERILGGIVSGLFSADTRLPSEGEISQIFRVSRPVVREAIARLRDDGLVYSRQGSGTYVHRSPSNASVRFTPLTSFRDVRSSFEFRAILESQAAALAAERLDQAGETGLLEAWQRFEAMTATGRLADDPDFAFHMAVASASGNRYFTETLRLLEGHIRFAMKLAGEFSILRPDDRLLAAHAEHRAIYDAVLNRRPEDARRAMTHHLEKVCRRLFEGEAWQVSHPYGMRTPSPSG
jgi:GntR family transcriptional regulator, transcriptional repressor for pyruvate dehydrogenase complex